MVEILQSLYTVGIAISGIKAILAMTLNGIFSLITKAPTVNMKQFNGEHGCFTLSPMCIYIQNTEPTLTARTHKAIM